jgi:hypothetical protein
MPTFKTNSSILVERQNMFIFLVEQFVYFLEGNTVAHVPQPLQRRETKRKRTRRQEGWLRMRSVKRGEVAEYEVCVL